MHLPLPPALLLFVVLEAIGQAEGGTPLKIPSGLRDLPIPADNPLCEDKVELGKQLFFDRRLSPDDTLSCASCHDPARGWSNGQRFATGIGGRVSARGVPTLINVGYQQHFFWDGRAQTLEEAVLLLMEDPAEMSMPLEQLSANLSKIPAYRARFEIVFGGDVSADRVSQALASFMRTILSGDTPYDRFRGGDFAALSPAARRGHDVFFFRAICTGCHIAPNLTDGQFHNIGIGADQPRPDLARFVVTQQYVDRGKFKTPTLREVAHTAPYMHDGRFKTLEEVVDYYVRGGYLNPFLDHRVNDFLIGEKDKADLVTFLREALSSPQLFVPSWDSSRSRSRQTLGALLKGPNSGEFGYLDHRRRGLETRANVP